MHPTQKSEKMLSELIKIHTNSGDVIMDPFMGSGTTGISAIKNNRKFIGIEIDEKFYAISKSRMNLSNKDLFKFSDLKC
jgi:DNA modification methylase